MFKFLGIAMSVDFFGTINTCFILFSLIGVFSQLRTIWRRKHANEQHPTHILSLKMFSISFLAYYSFFVYGMSIQPFNHYIVWPRLCASILVAFILYELWKDRKTISTLVCVVTALFLLAVGSVFGIFGHAIDHILAEITGIRRGKPPGSGQSGSTTSKRLVSCRSTAAWPPPCRLCVLNGDLTLVSLHCICKYSTERTSHGKKPT